jgi:hypothetical protein
MIPCGWRKIPITLKICAGKAAAPRRIVDACYSVARVICVPALIKGGPWVFQDRVLFEGEFFAICASVADLYHRCALGVDELGRNC